MNISDLNNDAKIALLQSGVEQLIEQNKQLQQQNDELRKALEEIHELAKVAGGSKIAMGLITEKSNEALSNNPKL